MLRVSAEPPTCSLKPGVEKIISSSTVTDVCNATTPEASSARRLWLISSRLRNVREKCSVAADVAS